MARLTTKAIIDRQDLELLAEARRREFAVLKSAGEYTGALYIGGYAIELLLKRAICTTLRLGRLPEIFHTHELEALLFFSGLKADLDAVASLKVEFNALNSLWSEERRYSTADAADPRDCAEMERWLFDPAGLYEWIRSKL